MTFFLWFLSNLLIASSHTCPNFRLGIPLFGERPNRQCPQRKDPIETFDELTKSQFYGQTDAVHIVENALKQNIYGDRNIPLVMHFSGPTGVGKTYLTTLIAESLFDRYDEGNLCGLLRLRMSPVLQDVQDSDRRKLLDDYLLRPIVNQLFFCPRSVIAIDDIQFLDLVLLESLKSLFDESAHAMAQSGPYRGREVSTKDAIFILTSDLEDQEKTLFDENLDRKAAIQFIQDLSRKRWQRTGHALMEFVSLVPFLSLSEIDYVSIIEKQIRGFQKSIKEMLEKKSIQKPYLIRWIGKIFVEKGTHKKILSKVDLELGGRAVENYLRQNLYFHSNKLVADLVRISDSAPVEPATLQNIIKGTFKDSRIISNDILINYDGADELHAEVEDLGLNTKRKNPKSEL